MRILEIENYYDRLVGTPNYMDFNTFASGKNIKSKAFDVYSMAAVMFRLLTNIEEDVMLNYGHYLIYLNQEMII